MKHLVSGEVAIKIVDALEVIEIEHQECAHADRERFVEGAHELAPVRQPRHRIGVGVAVGEAGGGIISVQRFLEVLGPAPAEQDDRDVEQEGDTERAAGVGHRRGAKRGRNHAASISDATTPSPTPR